MLTLPRPVTLVPEPATRRKRWGTTALYGLAVLVAAFTGFRMPGSWVATLDAVSVTDGFHRRILVGTLLRIFGTHYAIFAVFSFAVLAALLAVFTVAFVRERSETRRLLIIAWLLLPTGGFLFHEVGYYEQVLYLLLFAALYALRRGRPVLAAGLMTASVLAHEITALTVLPIFALVLLQRFPFARAAALLAGPVLVELVVLTIPASAPDAVARLTARGADFPLRPDAMALFQRTQSQSWQLYSSTAILILLIPALLVVLLGFLLVRGRGAPITIALQLGAVGAPVLLAFGGWDAQRWAFLLITNFTVVLWLRRPEIAPARRTALIVTLLLLTHIPLPYFENHAPRELTWQGVEQFADQSFGIPR